MHIQSETKVKITKSFKDIANGECFLYKKTLLMKIHEVHGCNTVNLESGGTRTFDDNDMVEPKNCKVLVE